MLGSMMAAYFAFIPAAVLIALAEACRLRAATTYAVAGMLAAGIAWLTGRSSWPLPLSALRHEIVADLPLIGPPGAAGGLVYWWIAGRTAGTVPAADDSAGT